MIIAKRGQKLKQRVGLAEILTNLCASQRRNCAPGSLTTVPFDPECASIYRNCECGIHSFSIRLFAQLHISLYSSVICCRSAGEYLKGNACMSVNRSLIGRVIPICPNPERQ
jgi:hypothetical protein